jgi:hypothetical protein
MVFVHIPFKKNIDDFNVLSKLIFDAIAGIE